MTPQPTTAESHDNLFLNRDHIVVVAIDETQLVVTTVLGTKFTVAASATTLTKFVDELTNHVESNFVSIASKFDN